MSSFLGISLREAIKTAYFEDIFLTRETTHPPSIIRTIGDLPVGAGGAAAPPDKETNLSTRNQKLMKRQFHTRNSVHDA